MSININITAQCSFTNTNCQSNFLKAILKAIGMQQFLVYLIRRTKNHKSVLLYDACLQQCYFHTGLEVVGCQWPKAGNILEMAGENKTGLPN